MDGKSKLEETVSLYPGSLPEHARSSLAFERTYVARGTYTHTVQQGDYPIREAFADENFRSGDAFFKDANRRAKEGNDRLHEQQTAVFEQGQFIIAREQAQRSLYDRIRKQATADLVDGSPRVAVVSDFTGAILDQKKEKDDDAVKFTVNIELTGIGYTRKR